MLSYYLCIKTLSTKVIENIYFGSWNESRLRGPVNFNKARRVTMSMVRITKLKLLAYLTLDSNSITGIGLFKSWFPTRMYRNLLITDLKLSYMLYYEVQRPNYINGGNLGTMGISTWRKSYGIGGLLKRLGFRCFNSVSDINDNSCVKLKKLINVNKKNLNYKNDKLIHIVSDLGVLVLGYEIIKNKPANTTCGADSINLNKINFKWFTDISKLIKAGAYKFKPIRRVYVPKPYNKIKRFLTISSPRDKVVQQAIYFILNAIYESSFFDSSHGSRSNKNTRTALKFLKYKFNNVKWCLKANIDNNFFSISHNVLLKTVNERISCQKFLALLKKSIKAGYMKDNKFHNSQHGLFQGSTISPILNNIYLHKFDIFMSELCESFYQGKQRRTNSVSKKIQYFMSKTNDPLFIKSLCRDLLEVDSKTPFNLESKRLVYIRYVDNFVVGVVGSHKDTTNIQEKIRCFLKDRLCLILSDQKMLITHYSKDPILFLGIFINWEKNKRIQTVVVKSARKKVIITPRVVLLAPIKKLFEQATQNGFFKKREDEFIPTYVGRLINLDHSDILSYYNSVIQRILKYYSFSNNRKSLCSLVHSLKFSCVRTLAQKYKLRFTSKAFKKFGSTLKRFSTKKGLSISSYF